MIIISRGVVAGVFSGNLTMTGIVCKLPAPKVTILLINEIVTSKSSGIFELIINSESNLKVSTPLPGFSNLIITNTSSSTSTS